MSENIYIVKHFSFHMERGCNRGLIPNVTEALWTWL